MTLQEIFDQVATHLLDQGVASVDSVKGCLYRGPEGTKCALGCLIPDNYYTKEMEGHGIRYLRDNDYELPLILKVDPLSFLLDLQYAHDKSLATMGISFWRSDMRRIADKYNLNSDILKG